MPNRIIKESLNKSEKISELSDFQFRVWIGLITYVDDYGRGDARPKVIKGEVFPLRERITHTDIAKAIADLAAVGCIALYEVGGRSYLQFPNWDKHQRVQQKRSKCPEPPKNGIPPYVTVTHGDSPPESESESESEERTLSSPQAVADAFNRLCPSMPKVVKLTDTRKRQIKARNATLADFEAVFTAAHSSDFLSGRSGAWSGCGFDWLLCPSNWQKVLEGNYANKEGANGAAFGTAQKPAGSVQASDRPRFDFSNAKPPNRMREVP